MAVKSKSTENKCAFEERSKVSYQRETEACTSQKFNAPQLQYKLQQQQQLANTRRRQNEIIFNRSNNNNNNNTLEEHQCELLESKTITTTTTSTSTLSSTPTKGLTAFDSGKQNISNSNRSEEGLAERKARLKAEFFGNSTTTTTRGIISTTTTTRTTLGTQRLKRQSNKLPRLKILSEEEQQQQQQEFSNKQSSLIAQRKAELWNCTTTTRTEKEHWQSRDWSTNNNKNNNKSIENSSKFPQVLQLIKKFDKMIVKPTKMNANEASNNNNNNMLVIKSDANDARQRHSPLSDEGCNLGQSPYSSDNEDNESIRTTATAIECVNNEGGMDTLGGSGGDDGKAAIGMDCCLGESKRKQKVTRSASSDSALGLEVDDVNAAMDVTPPAAAAAMPTTPQRRMTLTVLDLPLRPGLLPLAEPTALPDSPTATTAAAAAEMQANSVPSKVLLEERVIGIPEDPRGSISLGGGGGGGGGMSSRRESAQSCFSDYPNSECGGVRYVRTPSVVVSDYSDETMCGITLEEIEYFRAQRMRAMRRASLDTNAAGGGGGGGNGAVGIGSGGQSAGSDVIGDRELEMHSDVSAASSCSNLYYCGSTISALDGGECYVNGVRVPLERKTSSCSACSISGGDEDEDSNDSNGGQATLMDQQLVRLMAASHLDGSGCGSGSGVAVGGNIKKVGQSLLETPAAAQTQTQPN